MRDVTGHFRDGTGAGCCLRERGGALGREGKTGGIWWGDIVLFDTVSGVNLGENEFNLNKSKTN